MIVIPRATASFGPWCASNVILLAATLCLACSGGTSDSDGSDNNGAAAGAGGVSAMAGSASAHGGHAGQSTGGVGNASGMNGLGTAGTGGTAEPMGGASSGGIGSAGADAGGRETGGSSTGGREAGGSNAGGTSSAGSGGKNSGGSSAGGSAGAGGASGSNCAVTPVDPNATASAKKLLCYLYSQYKNHVLSGQQETSWSNPVGDIDFYQTNTGKYPAILGGDFLYTGTSPSSQGTTTSRAQAYWQAGGIPMFRYHMGAPPNADSYQNSMLPYSSAQCNNVVTAGTSENTSYKSKLDYVAGNLLTLQSAGVAVIFALFHETQPNGWFWWSKCSSSQFLALYKYSYDYLVNTKGVHNIVRLMPFSGSPSSSFYPGGMATDLAGPDTYATNPPFASTYSATASFVGSTTPIPLHETGTIPQPATMFPSAAPWLLWNVWAGYEMNNNSVANIKSAYASPYTITRDELPSFQ